MFHTIPPAVRERMAHLEARDAQDRTDNTPQSERLRQITPDTGKFLAMLLAGAPSGAVLEIGTSAGYSTLWLALACRAARRQITTYEVSPAKVVRARQTFGAAGVDDVVTLIEGDARTYLPDLHDIAFCFLDAEKEVYANCYDLVIPRLVPGGWLVADNALSHRDALQPLLDRALDDARIDALVAPIGKGELMCRKL